MRLLPAAVTILTLAASSLPAQRPQNPRRGQGQVEIWEFLQGKYDKNGDAKVSDAEYDRGADKNGTLEVGELSAVFKALDKDANRTVARDEMGLRPVLPVAGDLAPDFELPTLGAAEKLVKLSCLEGKEPVALIFGSYT
jgi:hypothetical protein